MALLIRLGYRDWDVFFSFARRFLRESVVIERSDCSNVDRSEWNAFFSEVELDFAPVNVQSIKSYVCASRLERLRAEDKLYIKENRPSDDRECTNRRDGIISHSLVSVIRLFSSEILRSSHTEIFNKSMTFLVGIINVYRWKILRLKDDRIVRRSRPTYKPRISSRSRGLEGGLRYRSAQDETENGSGMSRNFIGAIREQRESNIVVIKVNVTRLNR